MTMWPLSNDGDAIMAVVEPP